MIRQPHEIALPTPRTQIKPRRVVPYKIPIKLNRPQPKLINYQTASLTKLPPTVQIRLQGKGGRTAKKWSKVTNKICRLMVVLTRWKQKMIWRTLFKSIAKMGEDCRLKQKYLGIKKRAILTKEK